MKSIYEYGMDFYDNVDLPSLIYIRSNRMNEGIFKYIGRVELTSMI